MKKVVLLMSLLLCFTAQAEVVNVRACGRHTISADGRHYLVVENSVDLPNGRYEVFATNELSANLLKSLNVNNQHCIEGGFNPARPSEGISLISIDSDIFGIIENAANLNCSIGENQGKAQIEVLPVEGRPDLFVYSVNIATKLARYPESIQPGTTVQLSGVLLAKLLAGGKIEARGELNMDSKNPIPPIPVALYGVLISQGASFVLQDFPQAEPAGYIQLGYGVGLNCN